MVYLIGHLDKVATLAAHHIALTLVALAIAVGIAVPLGVLVARRPRAYAPVMGVLGVLYTIPSISLLVLLIPLLGLGALIREGISPTTATRSRPE